MGTYNKANNRKIKHLLKLSKRFNMLKKAIRNDLNNLYTISLDSNDNSLQFDILVNSYQSEIVIPLIKILEDGSRSRKKIEYLKRDILNIMYDYIRMYYVNN